MRAKMLFMIIFIDQRVRKSFNEINNTKMFRKYRYKIIWTKVLVKVNFKVHLKRYRGLQNRHFALIRSGMTYGGNGYRDSYLFRSKELITTALEQSERIKGLKLAI
jgi:hypothetical protein